LQAGKQADRQTGRQACMDLTHELI
jgi:hypothetical protein